MARPIVVGLNFPRHSSNEGDMALLYNFLKFLHVCGVIVWLGGMITMFLIQRGLARADDRAGMASLGRQGAAMSQHVFGMAAMTVGLTGIIMVATTPLTFTSAWVLWGFIGMFLSFGVGGNMARTAGMKLGELMRSPSPDPAAVAAARQSMTRAATINILILLTVVAAMVFKPVL